MKSLKIELETYFSTTWVATPIQYQGATFTQPTDGLWVSLVFIPIDRVTYAYDGANGRKKDSVQFKVFCYADNPTKALGLDDDVRTFLECWKIPNNDAQTYNGVPDTLGIQDLGNGIFEVASLYDIESYG